ncbi:NADP-dependent oxidoreductase [Actinomadura barringtoniae]|uniref:NADP-dependent oxidoreductase n=1 Tax=Actinomadura barringtoniae TaxID=1427535 RepID=A0A939T8E8_9ACTN|nr:NADP-dependent oxidoreductase [Actinomadura barringtoniae]MBO2454058.1 NADP-dependent oxidoreductase [Actinomadura barringtoniae]
MRAALIQEFGGPDVIGYEEVPRPVPGPGEVLVKVAGAAFNPSDIGARSGLLREVLGHEVPMVLGVDVSGTVAGEPVIGRLDRGGAMAEYTVAAADLLVRAPASIPLAEAAAIPVAGLTAWQAVHEHAEPVAGERVLINGAGGGVGMFAVQLAKHAGAHVVATASPRSADAARRYGADQVVHYTEPSWADEIDGPVDAVLNLAPIAPAAAARLLALLRPGGRLVSITGPVEPPEDAKVTATHFVARNDTAQLAALAGLVDTGKVRVEVAGTRAFSELADVHRAAAAGDLQGKIVLTP